MAALWGAMLLTGALLVAAFFVNAKKEELPAHPGSAPERQGFGGLRRSVDDVEILPRRHRVDVVRVHSADV